MHHAVYTKSRISLRPDTFHCILTPSSVSPTFFAAHNLIICTFLFDIVKKTLQYSVLLYMRFSCVGYILNSRDCAQFGTVQELQNYKIYY
jgi:hypothetical protein